MLINSLSRCVNSVPVKPGVSRRDTVKEAYFSGDILTLGADTQNVYTMYTSAGLYADSVSADSTMQTDDQKWEAITAKYRSSIMKIDDYDKMLDDLNSAGLITADQQAEASKAAWDVVKEKKQAWEIEHNRVGIKAIPSRCQIIHFDELISKLPDNSISLSESNLVNTTFLKDFYAKAKSAEMTENEKMKSVISKYTGRPIDLEEYGQMLCDLVNYNLMTFKELAAIQSHASAVVGDKMIDYDMQDVDLGNDIIPYSLTLVNFDELIADLSNPNRIYSFAEGNDPRPICKAFYEKMAGYFINNDK